MADYCKQCSIEIFGEDFGELAGLLTPDDDNKELAALALCEGCGVIQVSSDGSCVSSDCLAGGHRSVK